MEEFISVTNKILPINFNYYSSDGKRLTVDDKNCYCCVGSVEDYEATEKTLVFYWELRCARFNGQNGVWVLRAWVGACLWITLFCGRHGLRGAVGFFRPQNSPFGLTEWRVASQTGVGGASTFSCRQVTPHSFFQPFQSNSK